MWIPSLLASPRTWPTLKVLSKEIIQEDNGPEMLPGYAQSLGSLEMRHSGPDFWAVLQASGMKNPQLLSQLVQVVWL